MRKCSLCGKSFEGMGHNPMPLREYTERCCDDCNEDFVVPIVVCLDKITDNLTQDVLPMLFTEKINESCKCTQRTNVNLGNDF